MKTNSKTNSKLPNKLYINERMADMKRLFEDMPGYIYWKNKNSEYMGCNKNLARESGLKDPSEIVGKTDYDFNWGKKQAKQFRKDDLEIMKTGQPQITEYKLPSSDPNSQEKWIRTEKMCYYNQAGKIIGVIGVAVDVTKEKQLEKELLETKQREARFKGMSALGGMIAHELRTPLAGLKASAFGIQQYFPKLIAAYESCAAEGKVEPIPKHKLAALKTSIHQMNSAIDYAQATINSILAGFHHSTSLELTSTQSFPLKQTIQKAIEQYPFNLDQANSITVKKIDEVEVLGDKSILIHVIHNLIKNALYMISAEKKGKITIWTEHKKNHINLYLEDTAKGISPEELKYIFDAFYTTKNETAKSIGLGLYFCKMSLEKMQASIACESELGKYTRFKITLALPKSKEAAENLIATSPKISLKKSKP